MTDQPGNHMVIRRSREPRYWRETEDAHGHWVSSGQPGPPITVIVTPGGVRVHGDMSQLRPGASRWLSLRLAEAAGIYEAVFGGDGTIATDGGRARRMGLVVHGGEGATSEPPDLRPYWVCGCGKKGHNKGAMAIHGASCKNGPVTEVDPGADLGGSDGKEA